MKYLHLFVAAILFSCAKAEPPVTPSVGQEHVYESDVLMKDKWGLEITDRDTIKLLEVLQNLSPENLTVLRAIAIYRSENIDFTGIEKFPQVQDLTLSVCKLDEVPDLRQTSLEFLTIFGCNITEYDTVFYPPTLKYLDISGTYKTSIIGLRELKDMEVIGIGRLMRNEENYETISILKQKNPNASIQYTTYIE